MVCNFQFYVGAVPETQTIIKFETTVYSPGHRASGIKIRIISLKINSRMDDQSGRLVFSFNSLPCRRHYATVGRIQQVGTLGGCTLASSCKHGLTGLLSTANRQLGDFFCRMQ